jgi:hypothetical protein
MLGSCRVKGESYTISSYHYLRLSESIRNLLSVPSEQSIETAPIHLEHSNDVVRYFLDSLTPSPSAEMLVKVELCTDLLKLSDMFGTPQVERNVLNSMRVAMTYEKGRKPPIDAWGVFKVAAERDDVVLAKAAVRCLGLCGHSIKDILFRNPPSFVDGIPARYLHALLRCSLMMPSGLHPHHHEYSQESRQPISTRDWEAAADNFSLQ